MQQINFGKLGSVSKLSLGGAGIGQVWGKTTRTESISTILEAVENGITLLDMGNYGNGEAELAVGEAFSGNIPKNLKLTTKCLIGICEPSKIYELLDKSLTRSLSRMKRNYVDIFFMHNGIVQDGEINPQNNSYRSVFDNVIAETFEKFIKDGRIKSWGITGIGEPNALIQMLKENPRPNYIQVVSNLLDSPGSLYKFAGSPKPRIIMNEATKANVTILGIRPVQAGALTTKIDRSLPENHPEMIDFNHLTKFREFAKKINMSPALLAHRYALSMEHVSTVVLGVKNRIELQECLAAEKLGPLDSNIINQIDNIVADFIH